MQPMIRYLAPGWRTPREKRLEIARRFPRSVIDKLILSYYEPLILGSVSTPALSEMSKRQQLQSTLSSVPSGYAGMGNWRTQKWVPAAERGALQNSNLSALSRAVSQQRGIAVPSCNPIRQ